MLTSSIEIGGLGRTRRACCSDQAAYVGDQLKTPHDSRFSSLLEATPIRIPVPDVGGSNLFCSNLYSRWLAVLRWARLAEALPPVRCLAEAVGFAVAVAPVLP